MHSLKDYQTFYFPNDLKLDPETECLKQTLLCSFLDNVPLCNAGVGRWINPVTSMLFICSARWETRWLMVGWKDVCVCVWLCVTYVPPQYKGAVPSDASQPLLNAHTCCFCLMWWQISGMRLFQKQRAGQHLCKVRTLQHASIHKHTRPNCYCARDKSEQYCLSRAL